MKRRYKFLIFAMLLVIFTISPFFQFAKSLAVMSIYSHSEARYSLLKKENIDIDIPGGWSTLKKDWYPFVMTFNTSQGFSNYIGKEVELSILYNFGAFDYFKGASSYYDAKSPFFDAFYGAYVAKGKNFAFGYHEDGTPNIEEMALVPEYDMKVLVLESIGCTEPLFNFKLDKSYPIEEFLGYQNWDVIEATLTTSSPMSQPKENYQAFIQYGKPPKALYEGVDFKEVTVKGKIYARYFPEENCSIFLYVIAPNDKAVLQCEEDFLQKSKIKLK